ncbi:MAG: peptidoglycan DD-metalloendopeptidase family protein [Candidatus Wallbacteria bacterium]|nr:peptidoglycan DD-metalloendopeptidase family protein [Candidatus Wallbacteria bacterium]
MLNKWYKKLVAVSVMAIFVETLLILMSGFGSDSSWKISQQVSSTNLLLADKYLKLKLTRNECATILAENDKLDKNLEAVSQARVSVAAAPESNSSQNLIKINLNQTPAENFYKTFNLNLSSDKIALADKKTKTPAVRSSQKNPPSQPKKEPEGETFLLSTVGSRQSTGENAAPPKGTVIKIIRKSTQNNLETSLPGSLSKIGPHEETLSYPIRSGDNLWLLANRFNISVGKLISYNRLVDYNLKIGQTILIPGKKALSRNSLDFIWPTRGRITSSFGMRINPINSNREFHSALDIASPKGTQLKAAESGRVEYSGWLRGYGRTVKIVHRKGFSTLYGHLENILVKRGQYLKQGQRIGTIGSTGNSTGPHVHFEILQQGRQVNPYKFLP